MDQSEAKNILEEQLARYHVMSHSELLSLMSEVQTMEVRGSSGTNYGLEFEVVWDDESARNLRVIGSIDDGGWRAFSPISDSFIIREDGSFVGE
jgi:hypothetical protein